ncbi:hypothetical protein [Tepidibacillus marianensis]|uniref:hypothetical protein n=1 Tax=Tepidibacillus marianensis TaxID=3131995 RepID=UPI0030D235C7
MVTNLTPLSFAFQTALRADVSRAGEACDPGALTCIIFDPMVHPVIEGMKAHFWGIFLKGKVLAQKAVKSGFIFAEGANTL